MLPNLSPNYPPNYYFIIDNGFQCFSEIAALGYETDNLLEHHHVDNKIQGKVLTNIFHRELAFRCKHIALRNDTYYGWSISEFEFTHIKKLIELFTKVEEYNKLKDNLVF